MIPKVVQLPKIDREFQAASILSAALKDLGELFSRVVSPWRLDWQPQATGSLGAHITLHINQPNVIFRAHPIPSKGGNL